MEGFFEVLPELVFYGLGFVAIASAIAMVAQRHATYSAFAFVVTLVALSGIFGLLGSPFIAALQIVVYAGAIMVLFLFVLMLLNVRPETPKEPTSAKTKAFGFTLVILLVAQVGGVIIKATEGPIARNFNPTTLAVSRVLFEPRFIYVFEATSVLILAALVGSIALAKKDL